MRPQRRRLQADVALGFEEIEHIVVVPLHQFPVALGMVALGELKAVLHQPLQALKGPQQDTLDLCRHLLGNVRVVHTGQRLLFGGQDKLSAVETVRFWEEALYLSEALRIPHVDKMSI